MHATSALLSLREKVQRQVQESGSKFRLTWGMSRKLRFIPEGGSLVEVTNRTIQGRLLLRPSPQLNDILLGVLGRAQRLYPLGVIGYSFLMSQSECLALPSPLFSVNSAACSSK
jgi:hypothetical protein